ncbi:MAG TPA: hypothetical protein VFO36_04785 [Nitrospiraceae bacterium]|nr:hypothetical protein [Nitrospiraceae bacterium]
MSSFDGAVVKEQGVTFGIAVVRRSVLDNPTARSQAIAEFSAVFGGIPTVLMAQDGQGTPTYFGRQDIADFLASIPMESIPWQHYSSGSAT